MFDVMQRLPMLQQAISTLRLYALVDGAQYQTQQGKLLPPEQGMTALFAGTPDAALAHAGPWLVDAEQAGNTFCAELAQLERQTPAVTWLIAPQDLDSLAQLLQLKLDARLPDGRTVLLRFWDPRVLFNLAQTLDARQREDFFGYIHEWHLLYEGRRIWIGRHHADAY